MNVIIEEFTTCQLTMISNEMKKYIRWTPMFTSETPLVMNGQMIDGKYFPKQPFDFPMTIKVWNFLKNSKLGLRLNDWI